MTTPLYLLDASSILFRAYYAIPRMSAPNGFPTGALFGFIRSIKKLEEVKAPSHIAVIFDGKDNKASRRAIFKDYKATRQAVPEELPPQIEAAAQYCHFAGLPILVEDGKEADDLIAAVATFWAKEHGPVYICSGDKDLAALVNDNIHLIYLHKEMEEVDAAGVFAHFGVHPKQIPDYLALVGDSADNIPGVPGCGPKKAAALLESYGSVEKLLKDLPEMKESALKRSLEEEKENIPIYLQLATLDDQIPIPHHTFFYEKKEPSEKLVPFFHEMNFHSLLPKKTKEAPPSLDIQIATTEKECENFLDQLAKNSPLILDTESTGLDLLSSELVAIGIESVNQRGYLDRAAFPKDKSWLSNKKVVGHNIKFDLHMLSNGGFATPLPLFDTMIASQLLSPDNFRHNLDTLAKELFDFEKTPTEALIGKGKKAITMADVPIEKVAAYCAEDLYITGKLYTHFSKELAREGLETLFYELEMPLIPILFEMERRGIHVDKQRLISLGKEFEDELSLIEQRVHHLAGESFNLNSPKQLATILFEKLSLPDLKKGSTAIELLEALSDKHPIIPEIIRYRSLEKLRSTYVEGLLSSISEKTDRIHTSFRQTGTATGRMSSQDPNLQNIPIKSVEGQKIRSCFTPKEKGWVFLSADYSQVELRILAHLSGDPKLCEAFMEDKDIHRKTAALMFNLEESEVSAELRQQAKAINFGLIYGQQAFGLSKILGLPPKKAAELIERYFASYPTVRDFLEECKETATKNGFAKTLFGRKRALPDLASKNQNLRQASERLAVNTPIQGFCADLMKKAMIEVASSLKESSINAHLLLQIHDELLFECKEEEVAALSELVKKKLEEVYPLCVPLKVNLAIGKNWGDC